MRICGGALDGIEGVLIGRDSASTLVISIELIQRSLAVSVYNLDVEPVGGDVGSMHSDWRAGWRPGSCLGEPHNSQRQNASYLFHHTDTFVQIGFFRDTP